MKQKMGVGLLILVALLGITGCFGRAKEEAEALRVVDTSYPGIAFSVPADWESGVDNKETYYVSPEKQVLMIGRFESESNVGDMNDEWDRENFLDIARSGAINREMTSSAFVEVNGVTGFQVTYDTLNKTEVMKVIHTGFTKDKTLYHFLLLMPAGAADTQEYQRIISSIVFES